MSASQNSMLKTKIITKKFVKFLKLPKSDSRKRDNGRLLIIGGSQKYFGALLCAVKTASRIVDLVYILTTPENQKIINKLKLKTPSFIFVKSLPEMWSKHWGGKKREKDIDAILIGPGLGISIRAKKLVSDVLKHKINTVIDADALNVLDDGLKKLLSHRHILTPHAREFKRLFGLKAAPENAKKMAQKYSCTIVLKGPVDYIVNRHKGLWQNKTGNAGLTKGGTGDVLAGLIAAFFTANDAFTSAAAGTYINGAAGDDLYRQVRTLYNAEDLTEQIPHTFKNLIK